MTITSRILSIDILKDLTEMTLHRDDDEQYRIKGENHADNTKFHCTNYANERTSSVLAGLHACGDLSVTMLKTFLECKEVKAVVSIGCCYNLLSEERFGDAESHCGYPMSHALRSTGFSLGKSARDLACQSAERWKSLEMDAGIHNFELHAFRSAFQLVLSKYYPEVMINTPSIGRKGKALRRRHRRRSVESQLYLKESTSSLSIELSHMRQSCPCAEPRELGTDGVLSSTLEMRALPIEVPYNERAGCEQTKSEDKYSHFMNFCESGLGHLGIGPSHDMDFREIWKEAEPFSDIIGPYWSLRAALGPLLETLILLDRLLFLQEQGSELEAYLLPVFDPNLSPRNVAIIAKKVGKDLKT